MIKRHPYKSGNSVVVAIPQYMLEECHIEAGKPITMSVCRQRNCPPVIILGRLPTDLIHHLPALKAPSSN